MPPSRFSHLAILATLFAIPALVSAQTSVFGTNLIVNGGAEAGPGVGSDVLAASLPGWTSSGANVISYASGYGITLGDIVPVGAGANYFSNGDTSSSMTQTINVTAGAATIDAGIATFDTSGYFGGYSSYDDAATMTVAFLSASGGALGSFNVGGLKSADRQSTGLYLRRQIGAVPTGTRSIKVTVTFVKTTASTNNAGADNLSFIMNSPTTLPTLFGANVILNGNAESTIFLTSDTEFASDVPNWVRTAQFSPDIYAAGGADLDFTSPAPPDAGKYYFSGGPGNPAANAYQDIDISQGAAQIDTGTAKYALSAWLGGFSSQNDNCVLTVNFLDWSNKVLSTAKLGPVLAADRNSISALLKQTASGAVPAGARMVHVQIDMTRTDGSDNDGLADSLSLILSSGVGLPAISPNGVATTAAFGGNKATAPGSWLEIYGQNLGPDARPWSSADFAGPAAPLSLDGVKVTVAGQPAYVEYISAGQVNINVPSSVGIGQQQIVITNAGGSSAPYPITVNATQPGLLAPTAFIIGGKQYVAAFFADGVTFVMPPNTFPGVSSRQAKPGETIVMYGMGFGPTTPNIPAGQLVSQSTQLTGNLQVSFGSSAAAVAYKGFAPGFVSLYQFNVVVPNIANNDLVPLSVSLNGTPLAQTLYTAVHQ